MAIQAATIFCTLLFLLSASSAQQQFENNKQLDCGTNGSNTLGYTCTGPLTTCTSYLIFRSQTYYQSPASIADFLNSSATAIADINGVIDVYTFPINQLVLVPVPCSCYRPYPRGPSYYQHDAYYTLKFATETYMITANDTYQGLSTCQAMIEQNPNAPVLNLTIGLRLKVPIRCGCPSRNQMAAGYKYLLSYIIAWGDTVAAIAERFGADMNLVLAANEISAASTIFPYNTLLIPLKTPPTKDMVAGTTSPTSPPSATVAAPASPGGSGSSSKKWVIFGIVFGFFFALLCGFFLFCFIRRRRQSVLLPVMETKKPLDNSASVEYSELSEKPLAPSQLSMLSEEARTLISSLADYKYEDLHRATGGFDETHRIKGSSVYRGTINGDMAAVKRLKNDVSNEVNILKHINHNNLVRLSGFCNHSGNTYLVYEFAENGSLEDWIHGARKEKASSLSWKQRVQIAYDVADGLNYLHNYTTPPFVHKDLKSSNILLDGELRAKLTNFGLARVVGEEGSTPQQTRHVIGTQGYMSPEYLEHGLISTKIDVFAFGVVLLELLSGKEAIYFDEESKGVVLLSGTVEAIITGEDARDKLKSFLDPCLREDCPMDSIFAMAMLARRCVAQDPVSRPTITDVFVALSAISSSVLDWDPSLERPSEMDSMVLTS